MFYHQFILAKKAPLARVWLAAHWERKLSKALVSETDLPSSVESIISPKVKLALRTSGHLLLGVVRIYSRKTKYLLADCTEAFVKIKMAFRPGVVDLPEEGRELAFAAVTMPEVFTDLDMTLPELNEVEIHAQFTLNQGRIEEITMKEDIITNSFIGDDGFGDIMFEGELETEMFRHQASIEEPLNKTNDISKLSTIDEPKAITDSTLERSRIDIALDEPIKDDGFGGEGVDFLADGFGDELGGDALVPGFDDLPTTLAAVDVTLEPVDTKLDSEEQKETSSTETGQEESVINETANETTLLHNESEAFVLEPVEVVQKEKRSRRKRKLIVDDEKLLATEAIKSQLSDTSDIVRSATLAPPTKCRMKLKISSTVEKLFALPGTEFFALPVVEAFVQNLTKDVNGGSDTAESEEKMDIDEPEVVREEEEGSGIYEASKRSSVSFANMEANETVLPDEPIDVTLDQNFERPGEEEEQFLAGGVEDIYPNRDELEDNELEQELAASQTNEEQQSSETSEQFENRRWTKRTQQLLHTLKREFNKKDTVSFGSLVHKGSRKQVAYKFYSCLLLSKESSINVHQKKPFGDISISKGHKFDSVC